MANEARIQTSLQINHGNLQYQSRPTAFNATVTGVKGPVPGAFAATTNGTDVDFSELTVPGLCRIQNLDSTNYVIVGIWDVTNSIFFPVLELLPGESYVLRLSRAIRSEFQGTGTGTGVGGGNSLRIKGTVSACNVLVEAFQV